MERGEEQNGGGEEQVEGGKEQGEGGKVKGGGARWRGEQGEEKVASKENINCKFCRFLHQSILGNNILLTYI